MYFKRSVFSQDDVITGNANKKEHSHQSILFIVSSGIGYTTLLKTESLDNAILVFILA